jgi:hypothetical protein
MDPDTSKKTEDRGQMTEDGGQRTEDGGFVTAPPTKAGGFQGQAPVLAAPRTKC